MRRSMRWLMASLLVLGGVAAETARGQASQAYEGEFVAASVVADELTRTTAGPAAQCGDCGQCEACCDPCATCAPTCGFFFEGEALVMRYRRADGTRVGDSSIHGQDHDQVKFDDEFTPRFSAGYITPGGLGLRIRWWEYDHKAPAPYDGSDDAGMSVDTYTIDLELFERIALNANWTLEVSGGVRYNEFDERMYDAEGDDEFRIHQFSGFGGVLGLELRRQIGTCLAVYGRTRYSILADDLYRGNFSQDPDIDNQVDVLRDVTVSVLELSLGVEYVRACANGAELFLRAGYEWQQWFNYSSGFTWQSETDFSDPEPFGDRSDVGFHGFAFSGGVRF